MLVEIESLAGRRFGTLVVIDFVSAGASGILWQCVCDCGEVSVLYSHKFTKTRLSGCEQHRVVNKKRKLHPLYGTWKSIRSRCANVLNQNYGGKGIRVCPEWDDFKVFCDDMLACPGPGYQIDRIDSDGPYSKSNCRWLTAGENNRAKKSTLLDDRRAGEIKVLLAASLSLVEIAKAYGVSRDCVVDIRRGRTWRHVDCLGANRATR
jgi:hypothetical protein